MVLIFTPAELGWELHERGEDMFDTKAKGWYYVENSIAYRRRQYRPYRSFLESLGSRLDMRKKT